MDSKEFALAHAGMAVMWKDRKLEGRVVGYYKSGYYVTVEFDVSSGYGWSRSSQNGQASIWLIEDAKRGYFLSPEQLQVINPRPKITITPYPHTCKSCRASARKIGKIALCSNPKCRSRKSIHKTYSFIPPSKTISTFLKSGRQYYLDAWKNGGCILCGAAERGGNRKSHAYCWENTSYEDRVELNKVAIT